MLTTPQTTQRALYYIPENIFQHRQPAVPPHAFHAELDAMLEPDRPSGIIPLDISGHLETVSAATTPMLLARYVVIRAGERLTTSFRSSGEVYCVMSGTGTTQCGETEITWSPGDVFSLPGTGTKIHAAADEGAKLFMVNDEPALTYMHVEPAPRSAIEPVYYPWTKIAAHLDQVYGRTASQAAAAAGKAVTLSTTSLGNIPVTTPTIAATINTLEAGGDQRPHLHNAAAITLCLDGDGVHTMAGDTRTEWRRWLVMITPPTALHSHHNRGTGMMRSLSIHDGGIYHLSRTVGFSFG